jgi:FkbM family methyltransferase
MSLAHRAQRALRRRAPALAAVLTWRLRRGREAELPLVERCVQPGTTALDIGANWGLFSDRLARIAGTVHAFEPNPAHHSTLAMLERRHPGLQVHLAGASDRTGMAELSMPVVDGRAVDALASVEDGAGALGEAVLRRVSVELVRIDDILPPDVPPVSFAKCDVEGHELAALRGAEATLRRWHPTLLVEIEERHRAGTVDETIGFLTGLGYEAWCLRPEGPAPLDAFDLERDQLAHVDGATEYGMPDGYVKDFVFTARSRSGSPARRPT